MNNFQRFITYLSLTFLFVIAACDQSDNKDEEPANSNPPAYGANGSSTGFGTSTDSTRNAFDKPPKGFLSASDTQKPKNLKVMTADELASELNELKDLFPKDKDENKDDCIGKKLDKLTLRLQKKWIVINEKDLDMKNCMKNGNSKILNSSMSLFLAMFIDVDGLEASDIDGKTLSEIEDIYGGKSDNKKQTNSKMISEMKLSTSMDVDGKKVKFSTVSSTYGTSGGPCEDDTDDCEKKLIVVFENNSAQKNSYQKLTFKGVKGNEGDANFSAGEIEFELNNWTGVIKFQSKSAAPTWTAKNGNEKTSGILEKLSKNDASKKSQNDH